MLPLRFFWDEDNSEQITDSRRRRGLRWITSGCDGDKWLPRSLHCGPQTTRASGRDGKLRTGESKSGPSTAAAATRARGRSRDG